jgi:hypothetical protein
MRVMWALLSIWFISWFLIRLLAWSFGWSDSDWLWTIVYLIASGFCVTKFNQARKVY